MTEDLTAKPGSAKLGTGQPPLSQWLADAWADKAAEASIEVEDARIAYRQWGAQDTKDSLLFVHGFRAHARWWDHIAPHFTDRYRVAALDLSGMGDSDRRDTYSRAQHAREVLAVCRALGFERPVIAGHSYGGVVTLVACHLEPASIQRGIIIDSAVHQTGNRQEMPVRPERHFATVEEGLGRYRLIPPGGWPNAEILSYIARHSLRETQDGWTWKFDPQAPQSLGGDIFSAYLNNVMVPLDLVYGDRTEFKTPGAFEKIVEMLPGAGRIVSIPMSHHHVMIEQPVGLVTALQALLANPKA